MNPTPPQPTPDPTKWPVVECEAADVFLGTFIFNCATMTDEPHRPVSSDRPPNTANDPIGPNRPA